MATLEILCSKLVLLLPTESLPKSGLQWLIGSPFLPPLTIVSTIRCIHNNDSDFINESDDLRALLIKGFHVIGALLICESDYSDSDLEKKASEAIHAVRKLKLLRDLEQANDNRTVIGAVVYSWDISKPYFFVSKQDNAAEVESITQVVYGSSECIWERGCLLKCEVPIKFPFYYPVNKPADADYRFLQETEAVIAKFRDPQVSYVVETLNKTSEEVPQPVIVRTGQLSDASTLPCSHFCQENRSTFSEQNTDILQVTLLLNKSGKSPQPAAPVAEYFPALEEARMVVVDLKLEILCYAARDFPLGDAISNLIIPGLVDQLNSMKHTILPNLLEQHPQLRPYHFCLPGVLHPLTIIYELSYGETELKQVEFRRSLHLRLGLPLDRPMLRVANSLDLSVKKDGSSGISGRKGSYLLKDVHIGIPSSGVSGGTVSLVQGSYEYYHYLQNGFDDSGWGCAYRSLQTIISWFRLQHYTAVGVPSHREIQQALVEIGDKDPPFIGSREWIGAIELSFVLDKLLGVTCKVMNVRSGAELPERCRELALHFETQGTPIMIGGGVLAYTLLGVDYSETSGDCAFLILDPHYTGNDEKKKIINGGWCGWKKAVDSKGKNFFLHDKFYNLLLPQRPNMV
ncbi:hypothetical protein ACFE04_028345 [Oxalis oulophora]